MPAALRSGKPKRFCSDMPGSLFYAPSSRLTVPYFAFLTASLSPLPERATASRTTGLRHNSFGEPTTNDRPGCAAVSR